MWRKTLTNEVVPFPTDGTKPAKKPATIDDIIAQNLTMPSAQLLELISTKIPSSTLMGVLSAIDRELEALKRENDQLMARAEAGQGLGEIIDKISNGLDVGDAEAPLSYTLQKATDRGWM